MPIVAIAKHRQLPAAPQNKHRKVFFFEQVGGEVYTDCSDSEASATPRSSTKP